jgi:hypothetical protein
MQFRIVNVLVESVCALKWKERECCAVDVSKAQAEAQKPPLGCDENLKLNRFILKKLCECSNDVSNDVTKQDRHPQPCPNTTNLTSIRIVWRVCHLRSGLVIMKMKTSCKLLQNVSLDLQTVKHP